MLLTPRDGISVPCGSDGYNSRPGLLIRLTPPASPRTLEPRSPSLRHASHHRHRAKAIVSMASVQEAARSRAITRVDFLCPPDRGYTGRRHDLCRKGGQQLERDHH